MKRLARILAAGVALIVLASCQLPWEKAPAKATPAPTPVATAPSACVQLLASAVLVTSGVVAGSYACIDPTVSATATQYHNDVDIAALAAQSPIYTSGSFIGQTTQGYYYQTDGPQGKGCFRFHANAAGLVDRIAYGSYACPLPLP